MIPIGTNIPASITPNEIRKVVAVILRLTYGIPAGAVAQNKHFHWLLPATVKFVFVLVKTLCELKQYLKKCSPSSYLGTGELNKIHSMGKN